MNVAPYNPIKDKVYRDPTVLKIRQEDFEGVNYEGGTITFSFKDCRFNNIRIENDEEINFEDISVHFYGCIVDDINISNIVSKNITVHFGSSIISGKIEAQNLAAVSVNNCVLKSSLFLIKQRKVNISFTEENLFPLVWKKVLASLGRESFPNILKTKQNYYINETQTVNIRTNKRKEGEPGLYRDLVRTNSDWKVGYYLSDEQFSMLNINVSLEYSHNTEDKKADIVNSFLNSLSLSGSSSGKISIENTKINKLFIREFSTTGEATLFNITPKSAAGSKLEIHKSNLDNTWFDGISFSDYTIVSFFRTKFGKARFSSCDFPSDYTSFDTFKSLENIHYPENKPDRYYKNQYEIFLQLKLLLESSGNFYESQKLQAISNDALKQIKQIPTWDRGILWINSKSNNHGLSIKRPLACFFIFSIPLYLLYLVSIGRLFNGNEIDYSLVGYYFSFIDITHRSDFLVEKEQFNTLSLGIDFLNKLVSGFFIYQFVAAFRKYGKK